MKNKQFMRFIAILLSVLLCLQLGTTIVFAEEVVDSPEIAETEGRFSRLLFLPI